IEQLTLDELRNGNQTGRGLHEVHKRDSPLSTPVTIGGKPKVVVTLQLRLLVLVKTNLHNLIIEQEYNTVDTLVDVLSTEQLGDTDRIHPSIVVSDSSNELFDNLDHDYILS